MSEDNTKMVGELDKVQALVEALQVQPSIVAGVARALSDAIHSCNHVVKVSSGSVNSPGL